MEIGMVDCVTVGHHLGRRVLAVHAHPHEDEQQQREEEVEVEVERHHLHLRHGDKRANSLGGAGAVARGVPGTSVVGR
ncbi:hypothetical protein CRUP_011154 [Coryphaenoides rupestris]|nr:hypothetical protein CRUP_011154 [Coryphaenoides rupestris]